MLKHQSFILFFCLIFLSDFHFCFSKEWKRAYLASYPQSGNHWVRYLIEEATHIATSSVYQDPEPPKHMDEVFPWGGYCCDHGYEGQCRYPTKEDIVLIKTHYPYPHKKTKFDQRPYKLAIHIIRHPIDSFGSRYERLPKGPRQDKIPTERVKKFIESWRTVTKFWKKQKDVLTIRYEDMLVNPAAELKKILKALEYEFTKEDIERAVAKYPPQGHIFKHVHLFTPENLELMSNELSDLLEEFDYFIPLN